MPNNLYIVDNSREQQSVLTYLKDWCRVSKQMDIATGYMEIGGLLALDQNWQKMGKIRIILGDEVTKRTKEVVDAAVQALLDRIRDSIDDEQEKNEFLIGVPAIIDALQSKKIECRVYEKGKFHAKAYITYFSDEYREQFIQAMNIPSGYALVGSSNFTKAGLTKNIELNVQVKDDVEQLQKWYEAIWEQSTDITEAVLKVIEERCKEFSPYDVYLRSMYEIFKTKESTVSEWEQTESKIYSGLSQYQRDGYHSMVDIATKYSGAFCCDGVGLGKTFVGMMLIERFVKKERKNVVLLVPAAARVSVWETTIQKYIPEIMEGYSPFVTYPFKIINHTDLLLSKNQHLMDEITAHADVIIIDEAHHFRNRSSNRYRKLYEIMENGSQKQLFMLTATPINNSFLDLQHLIELFTHRQEDYFAEAPLGIHSLSGHFKKMENTIDAMTGSDVNESIDIADDSIRADKLVNALVVQRSRAYVKSSLSTEPGAKVMFPVRQPPIVANYDLETSYGKLIDHFMNSFYRKDPETGRNINLLTLAVYSPYEDEYYIGDKSKLDDMVTGRQAQIVNLIRMLLLKRFESSIAAFEETCIRIYVRLRKFMDDYKDKGNTRKIERLFTKHTAVWNYIQKYITENMQTEMGEYEDDLPDYIWETEENFDIDDFDIRAMLDDTELDMEVLAEFIEDMMDFSPENDDKIKKLIDCLRNDPHLKGRKVIVFTEFRATAVYIYKELQKAGFTGLYEIDGQSKNDRHEMVQRFAPYYNDKSSAEVQNEIQILIATDVLSEGLNLQDAACLINYELHWNPVRLMQRIGRIDRRRNATIESKMLTDHPELAADRANAYYWNFLPPKTLEKLLSLYHTVSKKTLRISKTFGIEGKTLLTPEDDYEALKDFNSGYEGKISLDEEIGLAYQKLMDENPDYESTVKTLPKKMHSGKNATTRKGVFFCYELPSKRADGTWTDGDGLYRWYLVNSEGLITDSTYDIWKAVKCDKEEPRILSLNAEQFNEQKKLVDSFIKKNYMKGVQAPMGVKPRLVTWMQLY